MSIFTMVYYKEPIRKTDELLMIKMIDDIDRKILVALSKDGRLSNIKIAEQAGIDSSTVDTRIERMLSKSIISIRAEPNPLKLGYKVMACIALNVEISHMEHVCDELTRVSSISSVIATFGKYPILSFAEYCDVNEFYNAVNVELPRIKGVKAVDSFLISKNKWIQQSNEPGQSTSDSPFLIDDIDRHLIADLKINGRVRLRTLADKYGLSLATISRRTSALIENHVIRITVFVNHALLGQHVVAFVGLQVDLKSVDEICMKVSEYPQVESVMLLTSGYNILATVIVPDLKSLHSFIVSELAKVDGILYVEPLIRAALIKRTYVKSNIEDIFRIQYMSNSNSLNP